MLKVLATMAALIVYNSSLWATEAKKVDFVVRGIFEGTGAKTRNLEYRLQSAVIRAVRPPSRPGAYDIAWVSLTGSLVNKGKRTIPLIEHLPDVTYRHGGTGNEQEWLFGYGRRLRGGSPYNKSTGNPIYSLRRRKPQKFLWTYDYRSGNTNTISWPRQAKGVLSFRLAIHNIGSKVRTAIFSIPLSRARFLFR